MKITQDPFFSVVIPLHNRASLIKKTIDSVFNQDTDVPFEIIIVDDGSTDDSARVIKEINDSRIKYIYQSNAGANTARNKGIDAAAGKYVALLDSDDTFLPHHLGAAYKALLLNPDLVIYSRIIVDRGNGRTFLKPPRGLQEGEHIAEYMLCDRGFLQTSTVVLKTSLAKKVRYAVGLPYGQDTDFALRLYAEGAAFQMLEEPGAIWLDIQDNNRVSSTKSSPDIRLKWLESVRDLITKRAYLGDSGWFVAKLYARQGKFGKALSLYSKAVLNGCYKPSFAMIVGMQIFFSGSLYRKIANVYIGLKSK